MKFAQEFYGCNNVPGVPIENDGSSGSAGSHFERTYFFNEVMTASDFKDAQFSGFGFALLEDSGWYSVDKKHYENFTAGKGMGCTWFEACDNKKNDQYFPKSSVACNMDSTAFG
jgi:hypothetical protein